MAGPDPQQAGTEIQTQETRTQAQPQEPLLGGVAQDTVLTHPAHAVITITSGELPRGSAWPHLPVPGSRRSLNALPRKKTKIEK